MKKVFAFTFLFMFFISGCRMSETYQMKKYRDVPTKYDNTYWCMSREEVKEVIDINEIFLIEDEESISASESRRNSDFAILCLDLMKRPKVTYKFYNDMLYEIELQVEDHRINQDLYNEFSNRLSKKYELSNESPIEETGGLTLGGRFWKIDEDGNEMFLVFTESIISKPRMKLIYSNNNLNRLIPNEIKYN